MRPPPLLVLRLRRLLKPRRLLGVAVEVTLLGWAVLLLEAVGSRAADDGADLVGFLAAGLLAAGLAAAARAGYMPATRRAAGGIRTAVVKGFRRLDPPAGVAFRLPEDPAPTPDRSRARPTVLLLVAAAGFTVWGDGLLQSLVWVREHLAYTPYLLGLGVLWVLFGAVTTIAFAVSRALGPGRQNALRGFAMFVLWLGAVVVLAWVPGIVVLCVAVVVAVAFGLDVARPHPGRYFLYRREPSGGIRYVTVHGYLVGYYALIAAALVLVIALAQAPRLWGAVAPTGAHTLTLLLGLSASVSALFLLVRAGLHVHRLIGRRGDAPETPLVPTLWWPGALLETSPWLGPAAGRGWDIVTGEEAPDDADLVVGAPPSDPRHFEPVEGQSVEDACFRLDRRFHVVKRREFRRAFASLHKEATHNPRPPGSGYLFCPHAWPVPGLVRDTAGADVDPASRSSIGGMLVGRPYGAVFTPRLRRYLGSVLRALDLDVVYWEDKVTWADIRRVFVVLFETYDQDRYPARTRHFIGLPRVTVLVQEAEEGEETWLEQSAAEAEEMPPPLRARALVIRRDLGGREIEAPDRAPASRKPEPMLV